MLKADTRLQMELKVLSEVCEAITKKLTSTLGGASNSEIDSIAFMDIKKAISDLTHDTCTAWNFICLVLRDCVGVASINGDLKLRQIHALEQFIDLRSNAVKAVEESLESLLRSNSALRTFVQQLIGGLYLFTDMNQKVLTALKEISDSVQQQHVELSDDVFDLRIFLDECSSALAQYPVSE